VSQRQFWEGFAGALETELFRREEIEDPTSKVGIHLQSPLSPSNYSSSKSTTKKGRKRWSLFLHSFTSVSKDQRCSNATIMMATAAGIGNVDSCRCTCGGCWFEDASLV
jgi:hypothetical protein